LRTTHLALALALSLCAFAFTPLAGAIAPVTCSQTVAVSGVDARCDVDGAPVYAGGGCGTLCTGIILIECQEGTTPTTHAGCELPYVFCPYGPICPGPYL